MKNLKTEYRWLLFIVIPLIIILAIHTAIPLVFLFTSQPLLIESYTQQNIQNLVTSVRSFVILQSEQTSTILNSYASFLLQLAAAIQKNPTFIEINASSFDLNNAYQFYQTYSQSHSEAVQVQQEAMWFAKGDTTYSQLDQHQKTFYQQFINVLPIIKFNFELQSFYSFVTGVYISFNEPDSQICFHFPSYSEPAFANLNSSIITSPFETYLATSAQNNQAILVEDIGVSQLQPGIMSICTSFSGSQGNKILGVICLEVSMSFFMADLTQAVVILKSSAISSQAYLLQPTYTNESDPHIISRATLVSSQLTIAFPINEAYHSLQGTQNQIWNQDLCNQGPKGVQSFSTFKNNNTQIDIVPICVLQEGLGWRPLMYYSLQLEASDLITSLNSTAQTDNLLQTLLIATMVAIFVSLLFSFCVLKKLLKDLDIQLYKLHKCCKFIANGDINIDIPSFSGTKDIAFVYEEVRIINKLFRYTSKEYFLGHSSDKILKYIEAINTFLKLNYNPSSLYENLGEVFIQLEDFMQAIRYLKQSVDLLSSEMVEQFGDFDKVMRLKAERETKLPNKYKQNELILIRRLWKLNYSYFLYFDNSFGRISLDYFDQEEEKRWKTRKDEYLLDMMRYITMFKQVVYPDYGTYAEAILLFLNQARFYIKENNFQNAKACWQKAVKYVSVYSKEYEANGVRLKQKGSKNKLFYRRHKLSRHSRCHPHILESYCKYIEALLKIHGGNKCDYYAAMNLLFQALKRGVLSQTVNFMVILKIIDILKELGIDKQQFQSTQVFRQILPRKTLNYKDETPDNEALFYKLQRKEQEVQSRQFVFMYDIGAMLYSSRSKENFLEYLRQRSQYIFDKHIKPKDRISITKFNSIIQLDTLCSLTYKQSQEEILKKSFMEVLVTSQFRGKGWMINSLKRVIYRVGHLQCEKVIVVFLRPIHSYVEAQLRKKSKNKASSPLKRGGSVNIQMSSLVSIEEVSSLTEIGAQIEQFMSDEEMRNCKLILLCSKLDDEEQVIRVFGLREINRRIWRRTSQLNILNNIVYVVSQKHKLDLQRILAVKTAHYADNHVFVL